MTRDYRIAVSAELLKARRSRLPIATFVVWTLIPAVAALLLYIAADADRARRLGLLGQKANLAGITADWPSLLAFLAQVIAGGDLLVFSFIIAWVFGRESVDGTLRYLLALPVERATIVLAKFTVIVLWAAAGTLWLTGLFVLVGLAFDLPGGGAGVLADGLAHAGVAAGLLVAVTTPVAYVACVGRGYLASLAAAITALLCAQVASFLGWAGVFPWAIPAVGAGAVAGESLGPIGLVVAVLTAVAGVGATLRWWRSGRAGA